MKNAKNKDNKIILKTIEPIKWISCKQIARIYSDEKYAEILFEVDDKKNIFNNKVFFDRTFLKNISFAELNESFNNKLYYYKIIINSKNN